MGDWELATEVAWSYFLTTTQCIENSTHTITIAPFSEGKVFESIIKSNYVVGDVRHENYLFLPSIA